MVALIWYEKRKNVLEFADAEVEHLATLRLHYVFGLHLCACHYGYVAEEVHDVEVIHGAYGTQLGAVFLQVDVGICRRHGVNLLYEFVGEHHYLIEIVPHIFH